MFSGSTANKMRWIMSAGLLVLCVSSTRAQVAMAQSPRAGLEQLDPETRAEFEAQLGEAHRAFTKKRYEEAITSLKRAYAIYPHPRIFYKLGQAHEELGADRMAKEAYETYLDSEDPDKDVDEIASKIARLDARLNRPSLMTIKTTPAGARVYLDGEPSPIGTTPLYHDLPPGKHTISIELEGHERRVLELSADSGNVIDLEPTLTPSSLSLGQPFSGLDQRQWLPQAKLTGLISLSTGVAGGTSFLLARRRGAQIDEALSQRGESTRPNELEKMQSQHNALVGVGWGLMGVSLVTGSMSLMRWHQDRAKLAATIHPSRTEVSLKVSF